MVEVLETPIGDAKLERIFLGVVRACLVLYHHYPREDAYRLVEERRGLIDEVSLHWGAFGVAGMLSHSRGGELVEIDNYRESYNAMVRRASKLYGSELLP